MSGRAERLAAGAFAARDAAANLGTPTASIATRARSRDRCRRGVALAVIALASAAGWQVPAIAQRSEPTAEVRVPSNLRAGPGMGERVLKVLPRGARVQLLGQSGAWSHVRHVDRRAQAIEGWIATRLLVMPVAAPELPESVQPLPHALPALEPGRYLVQVLVPTLAVHESPDAAQPVIARLEQGARFEADARRGDWYRLRLGGGRGGWARAAAGDAQATLAVQPFPAQRSIEYTDERANEADAQTAAEASGLERERPQGAPIEPAPRIVDPAQVPPPTAAAARVKTPVPDRWRVVKSLGLLPYNVRDPYNPNVLKGDLPVLQRELGDDWFFNLSAASDTLIETRALPTTAAAGYGRRRDLLLQETGVLNLSLIKGDSVFRPPDYQYRFVPAVKFGRTMSRQSDAVDGARSFKRDDGFVGIQGLFADVHLRDVSVRYDFDGVRAGIQPFTADFRGFLFYDQPLGVRLYGNRDDNRWQYNAAWFRRLEKDTYSGFNDVTQRPRADDVLVANLYRQDWPVAGFTSEAVLLHNINREGSRGAYVDDNGVLARPLAIGAGLPRNYDVTYLGYNGDGHLDRWNLSASVYLASGSVDHGTVSGNHERIEAGFGAFELSRDFDWIRLRLSALYASGDRDPNDGRAGGFDAVLENPVFAGADTGYWIRQSLPFAGGAGLSLRNGLLPSLRASREHGQSNFTNPGLRLISIGADVDISPRLRVIANVNELAFDNTSSLEALSARMLGSKRIGIDASVGLQYRPDYTQNLVINAALARLMPGRALRDLYGDAIDGAQYAAFIDLLVAF